MKTGGLQRVAAAAGVALLLSAGAAWAKAPTPKLSTKPHRPSFLVFHSHQAAPDTIEYSALKANVWKPKPPNPAIPGDDSLIACKAEKALLGTMREAFLEGIRLIRARDALHAMPQLDDQYNRLAQKFADTLAYAHWDEIDHNYKGLTYDKRIRHAPPHEFGSGECLSWGDFMGLPFLYDEGGSWEQKLQEIDPAKLRRFARQLALTLHTSPPHKEIVCIRFIDPKTGEIEPAQADASQNLNGALVAGVGFGFTWGKLKPGGMLVLRVTAVLIIAQPKPSS